MLESPTIIEPSVRVRQEPGAFTPDSLERLAIFRWLATTAWIVVLCLISCEFVARFWVLASKPQSSPNPQYDSKFRIAKTLNPRDCNIVLLGDSLMKEGIYPELVGAKLRNVAKENANIRVVNLAVTGGTQKDAVVYLEYLRHRNVHPRLVVFDYEVSNTCLPIEANNIEWGQSHSYLFRGQLSRPGSLRESMQVAPSDFSYLIRQRANLKRMFADFCGVLQSSSSFEQKSFFELKDAPEFEISKAGMAPNNKITENLNMVEEQRKIGFFAPFCPKSSGFKYNSRAYAIIAEYCQKHSIPLLLVWLPHQRRIYDAYYYQAPYDQEWHRRQFENQSQQPLVSTEYLNVLADDCIYFHDYRHLNTYGCVKTSELLAQVLAKKKFQKLLEGRVE